jgi:hypothetical protein
VKILKNILATAFLSIVLLVSVFVAPVSAQNNLPNDSGVQTPGTTTTDNRGGFDLWWLLPLLAIPLFFVLFREDRDSDRDVYRDSGIAGTKGGETRRRQERDEDIDEDEDELI